MIEDGGGEQRDRKNDVNDKCNKQQPSHVTPRARQAFYRGIGNEMSIEQAAQGVGYRPSDQVGTKDEPVDGMAEVILKDGEDQNYGD